MTNKICVSTDNDSLSLTDHKIYAVVDSTEYVYDLDSVERIVILTTDMGDRLSKNNRCNYMYN